MHRSLLAAALVSALCPLAAADDDPPSTPAGVTATLYRGAGGELFWQRATDDLGVRGYEITLNGENLGVRDALSYYDRSLRSGTAYTFTVTAIDSAGQRSGTAVTTLGEAAADVPAAPAGLKATVYSRRSAELFWTRPATPGLSYEIRRDGAVVDDTDGVSHYARGLSAGTRYAFEVIAIDAAGRRSPAAGVTLRTRGTATGTPPPVDPVPDPGLPPRLARQLAVQFEVVNAVAVRKAAATVERLSDHDDRLAADGLGFTPIATAPDPDFPQWLRERYACPQGGELVDIARNDDFAGPNIRRFETDRCAIGPITISGRFVVQFEATMLTPPFGTGTLVDMEAVRLDDTRDGSVTSMSDGRLETDPSTRASGQWFAIDLRVDAPDSGYSAVFLNGIGADDRNTLPDGSLGLTFVASGIEGALGTDTGTGTPNRTRTDGPFEFGNGREPGYPTVGRMTIASGEDRYRIDAFDGDPATFTFTVQENGSTIAYTVPWSADYRIATPTTDGASVGF